MGEGTVLKFEVWSLPCAPLEPKDPNIMRQLCQSYETDYETGPDQFSESGLSSPNRPKSKNVTEGARGEGK